MVVHKLPFFRDSANLTAVIFIFFLQIFFFYIPIMYMYRLYFFVNISFYIVIILSHSGINKVFYEYQSCLVYVLFSNTFKTLLFGGYFYLALFTE